MPGCRPALRSSRARASGRCHRTSRREDRRPSSNAGLVNVKGFGLVMATSVAVATGVDGGGDASTSPAVEDALVDGSGATPAEVVGDGESTGDPPPDGEQATTSIRPITSATVDRTATVSTRRRRPGR